MLLKVSLLRSTGRRLFVRRYAFKGGLMFWKIRLFLIGVFFTMVSSASAQTTLDQLVPVNRQKQLGFDKLSAQQRVEVAKLLQEVYQIGEQEGKKAAMDSKQSSAAGGVASSVIETQIDGDFEGWEGETIVKLMNGQIWQQTEYYYYYYYTFMPKVLIYRSGGGYKMKVEGVEKAVSVERMR